MKVKLAFYEGTRHVYEDSLQERERLPVLLGGQCTATTEHEQAEVALARNVPGEVAA